MRMVRTLVLTGTILLLGGGVAVAVPYEATPPVPVSPVGSSPFAHCDAAVTAGGTVYVSGEVEPYVASNPADPDFLVGGWQQDRWSDGGASGNSSAVSTDGGDTWAAIEDVKHSICSGAPRRMAATMSAAPTRGLLFRRMAPPTSRVCLSTTPGIWRTRCW